VAETLRDLSDRLSGLLSDLDIAVRVRLRESEKQAGRQLAETGPGGARIGRAMAAALRWLTRPGAGRPASRRVWSAREKRSGR